jgi:hypothetical protein
MVTHRGAVVGRGAERLRVQPSEVPARRLPGHSQYPYSSYQYSYSSGQYPFSSYQYPYSSSRYPYSSP